MKKVIHIPVLCLISLMFLFPAPAKADLKNLRLTGDASFTLQYYDFEDNISFLQKYHSYLENAWGGVEGFSMDLFDETEMRLLSINIENPFYLNEHLNMNAAFTPSLELDLDVSRYRTNPEHRSLIGDPLKVISYGRSFVDVSLLTDEFEITRLRTHAALLIKEPAAGGLGDFLKRIRVDFFNEFKDGQKQQFFGLGGSSGAPTSLRMRGMTQRLDQEVNRYGFNVTLTPIPSAPEFTAILDFHRDEFHNRAPDFLTDFNDVVNANTAFAITNPQSALQLNDSNESSAYLKLHHSVGDRAYLSFGGRFAKLTEDDPREDKYQIERTSLLFTTTVYVTDTTNITGYYRFFQRDNNSDFGPTHEKSLASIRDGYLQKTDRNVFGVDLLSRPTPKVTTGIEYKLIVVNRDLIFGTNPGQFIPASVQLFNDRTQKNIFTARFSFRPSKVFLFRGRYRFQNADETHIVRESSQTNSARLSANISPPNTSAYISLQSLWNDKENDQFSWTGTPQTWEFDSHDLVFSGGMSLNERVSLFAQYTYRKQEENSNWVTSNLRRWNSPLTFTILEPNLGYENKNSFGSLGANVSINPKLGVNFSYVLSDSKGNLDTAQTSPSDGTSARTWSLIDNMYHGVNGGINYHLSKNLTAGANFTHYDYDDDAYDRMSGAIFSDSSDISCNF